MYVFTNEKLKKLRESQPWHVYQRVVLATIDNHFLFQLPFGFWYVLREIRAHYAETDTPAGNVFPDIRFEVYLMGANKWPQNAPVPFRLSCTPGGEGVVVNGAGELTAGSIGTAKMINSLHPVRDTLNITIVRQGVGPFVPFVDLDCVGYLIPHGDMWVEGGKGVKRA